MQQAIFFDIALFFPGLIAALISGIGSISGFQVPTAANQLGSTAIFFLLIIMVAYASISSLLGITPNKIPIISQAVEDRMPSIDMFDDQGRFIPRQSRKKKSDGNDKKD